jgi:hypothetical protein
MLAVLIGFLVKPPDEPSYKYRDTIRFCNKETGEAQKTIKNAEFRLLDRDDIMYAVKTDKQEVLVMEKIPSECFVTIRKDSDE